MIRLVKDPAETDSTTLVIMAGKHEWYFWLDGRKPRKRYYKNPYYVKGTARDQRDRAGY